MPLDYQEGVASPFLFLFCFVFYTSATCAILSGAPPVELDCSKLCVLTFSLYSVIHMICIEVGEQAWNGCCSEFYAESTRHG